MSRRGGRSTEEGRAAYVDEARINAFRALVHRLRTEAGLTQVELAGGLGRRPSTRQAVRSLSPPLRVYS